MKTLLIAVLVAIVTAFITSVVSSVNSTDPLKSETSLVTRFDRLTLDVDHAGKTTQFYDLIEVTDKKLGFVSWSARFKDGNEYLVHFECVDLKKSESARRFYFITDVTTNERFDDYQNFKIAPEFFTSIVDRLCNVSDLLHT